MENRLVQLVREKFRGQRLMAGTVQILRIGPIPDAPPDAQFLYVPVSKETGLDQMISAADDTGGFAKVRAALPDADLVCDPAMRPYQADAEIAESVSRSLRELRFDLALAVFEEKRLPASDPPRHRRLLLRHVGPFIAHPSVFDLLAGGKITSRLEIRDAGGAEVREIMMGAAGGADGGLTLAFTGQTGKVEVELSPPGKPGYLEMALYDAFGLETMPRARPIGAELDSAEWGRFYLDAGLTCATAAAMDASHNSGQREFSFDDGGTVGVRIQSILPG